MKNRVKSYLGILFIAAVVSACNVTRVVKPLAKNEMQAGAGFGGAMIKFGGAPIPIPLTQVYGAYGLTSKTTGFASVHTTALLFGVFQTDIGITRQILPQHRWKPGLSISPIANMMFDRWDKNFNLYPQVDINAFWNYGKKQHLIYATLNNWFELKSTKAHNETQTTRWLPSLGIGHQWSGKKLSWQLEVKYIAPNQSNQNIVVDYIGAGNSGTWGLFLGVNHQF